jgi:hypothetical protein
MTTPYFLLPIERITNIVERPAPELSPKFSSSFGTLNATNKNAILTYKSVKVFLLS